MIGVVLDTNIVVSALLKPEGLEDQVFRLCLAGRLRPCLSPAVLDEYELVLPRPKFKLTSKEVTTTLNKLRQASSLVHSSHTLKVASHEPDNRFLECAEAAQADFLVSGNRRHFPKQWKTTKVVNARELLSTIS